MIRRAVAIVSGVMLAATALLFVPGASGAAPSGPPSADDPPLGNLAPTPPLGWNSWNTFGCDINEQLIKDMADAMIASGMREAGYEYVNIDDCWMAPERDAQGRLQPDPERFPHGIKAIADYVHARGLKLGIYSSAGTATCQGLPASLGHEDVDAQSFADWGVDLLKYDNCNNQGVPAEERYQAMADAIEATGRPILYSICEWGSNDPWLWAADVGGHMWRTTGDITDTWESVMGILDQQVGLEAYSGPNAWNDPDMLEVGNPGLTRQESRAHMSLWALLNAPLIAGNDLRNMPAYALRQLTDPDVLAVNQDWGGEQGSKLRDDGDTEVWSKPMSDGSVAVVLLNRGDQQEVISTTAADLGLGGSRSYAVHDVWSNRTYSSGGTVRAAVESHAGEMFVVSTAGKGSQLPPLVTLDVSTDQYVVAGDDSTATTTLYNDGVEPLEQARFSLTAGQDWEVTPVDDRLVPFVRPGRSAAVDWQLENQGAGAGEHALSASASWLWRRNVEEASVSTGFFTVHPLPAGESQLSDLDWVDADSYWGPVERDMSNGERDPGDGGPITIGGVEYAKGLGVHAPSSVLYFPGGGCSTVSTVVGIDDEVGDRGEAVFELWGDDQLIATSGNVTGADAGVPLTADLTGVELLELRVVPGDSPNYDHADWADARITCG